MQAVDSDLLGLFYERLLSASSETLSAARGGHAGAEKRALRLLEMAGVFAAEGDAYAARVEEIVCGVQLAGEGDLLSFSPGGSAGKGKGKAGNNSDVGKAKGDRNGSGTVLQDAVEVVLLHLRAGTFSPSSSSSSTS